MEKEYLNAQREIDNVLLTAYEIDIIQNILIAYENLKRQQCN